jgi:hypothetical protein
MPPHFCLQQSLLLPIVAFILVSHAAPVSALSPNNTGIGSRIAPPDEAARVKISHFNRPSTASLRTTGFIRPPLLRGVGMTTALCMSSLGKGPEESDLKAPIFEWVYSKLPPPPEDQLSMGGDVGCLFMYSFIDHCVNNMYDSYLNSPDTIITSSASSAIESSLAASAELSSLVLDTTAVVPNSLPVWFDAMSSAPFGTIPLRAALPIEHHITYAPAISDVGTASVVLCLSWLLSGYITGAFQFRNTLECSTQRALSTTGKTWILNCIVMLGIAWGSDYFVGNLDCLHKSVGVTKADADFIFGSLTVVLIWRYILSSFFGYDRGGPDKK